MKNFGLIKTVFNDLMIDALVTENKVNKDLYRKFLQTLKKNKIMKAQFEVYNLLEGLDADVKEDDLNFYIKESISLLDSISRDSIIKENLKTFRPILEKMPELEFKDYPEKKIHESIAELIFTKKNSKTINSILKHTNVIKENLINSKVDSKVITEEKKIIPNSILTNLMVEKFKEKYGNMSDIEKVVFMSFIKEDNSIKEDTFKFLTKECVSKVNNKLETDLEIKETLLNVKETLLTNSFTLENYKTDILKLVDLYNDLD